MGTTSRRPSPPTRISPRRRRGEPLEGAEARLRVYDPYFCTGRAAGLLGGLGFPRVNHEQRDFYADVESGSVPSHHVLVTNPPYSGDHKERLLEIILGWQRRAHGRGVPAPFLLLLPSWSAGKKFFRRFVASLSAAVGGAEAAESGAQVFYVCRRGSRGEPAKYEFDHVAGAGKKTCPFFGLWFCGGFGQLTARAVRRSTRGWGEAYWEHDGRWHAACPLKPDSSAAADVLWDDGTSSTLPSECLRGGRFVFTSLGALEAAGLSRSEAEARHRQETNPEQRKRREIALRARDKLRADAAAAEGGKRRRLTDKRTYVKHEGSEPAAAAAPNVCRHFFSSWGCSRGEHCRFSHAAGAGD